MSGPHTNVHHNLFMLFYHKKYLLDYDTKVTDQLFVLNVVIVPPIPKMDSVLELLAVSRFAGYPHCL